jgi:hypothetical protein
VDFRTVPVGVRPNPLWFWNDTRVEPEELKRQMAGYKEAGYGGLSILPFGKNFKPEYPGLTHQNLFGNRRKSIIIPPQKAI